ncbi:hypothetical protein PPYR_00304 [Photinus pyralis]|uniref:Uncharacterized protein n=1 Tax=Photinus pyralis TaxID=7054 RepID=A0A1Y1MRN5_PHOPY|nr:uncharacterized protein LOC116182411 [Photinus pyralis]KAB0803334.1 hypothetical protein PPYR_00304 [Photinus pyralis]
MALFQFHWLTRLIKRHTKPIPEGTADLWKRRLSYLYAIIAWNAFGFVAYSCYTGNQDWAKRFKSPATLESSPARQWTQTLKIKDATVYKISGSNLSRYEIHNEFPAEDEAEK